jgi:hypothetical protein
MKILKYSKYSFLNDCKLDEGSEFLQYQFGLEPMGTQGGGGQYAFAQDPSLSYSNYQDSPFCDFYARQSGLVANLDQAAKQSRGQMSIFNNDNSFLEDVGEYKNLKILRIFENNILKLDVYISFDYNENEFFGVFRNFNGIAKPKLESELYHDPNYKFRFDSEYKLRLGNFFYKKLEKWFIPNKGLYKNMKNENRVKDTMGKLYEMQSNQVVEVLGYNMNSDNKPYIILKYKDKTYHVEGNDYYYFKWRFQKLNEK